MFNNYHMNLGGEGGESHCRLGWCPLGTRGIASWFRRRRLGAYAGQDFYDFRFIWCRCIKVTPSLLKLKQSIISRVVKRAYPMGNVLIHENGFHNLGLHEALQGCYFDKFFGDMRCHGGKIPRNSPALRSDGSSGILGGVSQRRLFLGGCRCRFLSGLVFLVDPGVVIFYISKKFFSLPVVRL